MIISASRRTDIPALYPKWLCNRLEEGYVLVPYPRNSRRFMKLTLDPKKVDCLVFWTKNPGPLTGYLDRIDDLGYKYYFEFTLTPYDRDLEPSLQPKEDLLTAFISLSRRLGPRRVDFRYDPIIVSSNYSVGYHLDNFARFVSALAGSTERVIISFVDQYRHVRAFSGGTEEQKLCLAQGFGRIGAEYKMPVYTCAEKIDLSPYGIEHASCIDRTKIESILGYKIAASKDPGQRADCGCIESLDIGAYNTCSHLCSYCYATTRKNPSVRTDDQDNEAPSLSGFPRPDDQIVAKEFKSLRILL
jgi:hypothetical protein